MPVVYLVKQEFKIQKHNKLTKNMCSKNKCKEKAYKSQDPIYYNVTD